MISIYAIRSIQLLRRHRGSIFRAHVHAAVVDAAAIHPRDVDEGVLPWGKLALAVGSERYFTGSPLMVQRRLALGTDGQEVQLAVTFSPRA